MSGAGTTRLVRAENPGPMTLDGTNTWLVGRGRVLVVDPGPADEDHVAAVLAEVRREGGRLGGVLLTHRHPDHAAALRTAGLRSALDGTAAPVLALDPALGVVPTPELLRSVCDEVVRLLPLPGHTDDSAALVVARRREVLTGDTVLGRGTSVVAHPDGHLGSYLASLAALLALVADDDGGRWRGLPGHGPVLDDLAGAVRRLQAHRQQRLAQVRDALASIGGGAGSGPEDLVRALVTAVYPEVDDPVLQQAAARTVRATLVHLAEQGA